MLKIGIIGCGYWGPNLIRNLHQQNKSEVVYVADLDESRLSHMKKLYPSVVTTLDYAQILNDPTIDAVAIATPVKTHFKIASEALSKKKHVFIEKPITDSVEEAKELIRLSEKNKKKLMVGHTFVYTTAVQKMREIIDSGQLGEIYYINSQRLNLGLIQKDINVIWDLAPHDISIILYLLRMKPQKVSAVGTSHINLSIEDVALLTMRFSESLVAFIQTSWLDPDKIRKMTIVGSKKMMVYDDVSPTEKIRIYDKSVKKPEHYNTFAEFHYSYKYGDIIIPRIGGAEPLNTELNHFLNCIINNETPMSDGQSGLEVVEILEAAQESIKTYNNWVKIN